MVESLERPATLLLSEEWIGAVEIRRPTWQLPGLCPVCEQGSSLTFRACPSCARLIIICDEEGAVFTNPRNLTQPDTYGRDGVCPGCQGSALTEFVNATDVQIRDAGFSPGEYV